MNVRQEYAVVTGASSGIGEAVTKLLLDRGVRTIGLSRRPPANNDVRCNQDFSWLQVDLSDPDSSSRANEEISNIAPSLDYLANCAGILTTELLHEETLEDWQKIYCCNVQAPFFLIQSCLPLLERGGGKSIVNISSNAGRMGGVANSAAYAASKGAVIAMTYSLARKLASKQIRVNCIAPGPIDTPMFQQFSTAKQEAVKESIPLKSIGSVADVAEACWFVLGGKAKFITGAVLDVNGGIFTG